jgi:lipopolysaccharide biosynthesis glycosyltransferase
VLVMNLPVWRASDLADEILRFAREHQPLLHSDQDAMNAVITEWHCLNLRWNVQSKIHWLPGDAGPLQTELARNRARLLESAAVLHFSGPDKPWYPMYRSPGAGSWRRSLRRSTALTTREYLNWAASYFPRRAAARAGIAAVRAVRRARRS